MVELYSLDDVGQGYDIALGETERIVATLGRHPNDWSPRTICTRRPTSWWNTAGAASRWTMRLAAQEMTMSRASGAITGCSMRWGPRSSADADAQRPRAPLQVMEGNYHRMGGVCPWWDWSKRGSEPSSKSRRCLPSRLRREWEPTRSNRDAGRRDAARVRVGETGAARPSAAQEHPTDTPGCDPIAHEALRQWVVQRASDHSVGMSASVTV